MAVRLIDLQLLYGVAGAREQFENLCAQLIRSQSPTATGIRVHRGDGGIDVYEGKFTGEEGIHVFQVKYFPNGLGKSQRNEVKESFTRCRTNTQFSTRKWTLCLPVDLSVEETEWFSHWAQESEAAYGINIDCWGATELESLLYYAENRGIREAFFKEEHLTQIREMHGMLQHLISDFTARLGEPSKEAMKFLRSYRAERLDKIIKGETPAKLNKDAPKFVLHIVPFSAFELGKRFNLAALTNADNVHLLEPLKPYSGGYNYPEYKFDGLLSNQQGTYTQIFYNGGLEAVDTTILSASRDLRITTGNIYEKRLLGTLERFLAAQRRVGVEPPLLVMVSLLEVEGYTVGFDGFDIWGYQEQYHRIDRPKLVLPEILIDSFDCNITEAMRPAFDAIANAAGWARSMTYDENGKTLLADL